MNSFLAIALFIAAATFAGLAVASRLLASHMDRIIEHEAGQPEKPPAPTATPTAWVTPDRALHIYQPAMQRYLTEDLHRDPSLSD